MNLYPRARFGATIYGRCERPFVQRVLVPWTVRTVSAIIPEGICGSAAGIVRGLVGSDPRLAYARDYPVEFGLTAILLFGCLIGFALALQRLARMTLGPPDWQTYAIPVLALALLPGMYTYMNYVYDLPNLFLFTLGLALIAGHSRAYLPLFVIATVNKETAILLTLVWLLENRERSPARLLVRGLGIQVLLWLVVRGVIGFIYRHNPGDAIEWHLPRNLATFSKTAHSPFDGTLLAQLRLHWHAAVGLLVLAALLLSLKRAPRFLRYAACVGIPILVTSVFFSLMEELRIYYELYPTALLVLASGAASLLGRRIVARPDWPRPARQ